MLRVNYDTSTRRVTGFNALGVRLRHEVCERWLRAGVTIDEVLPQLGLADFDPEWAGKRVVEAVQSWT